MAEVSRENITDSLFCVFLRRIKKFSATIDSDALLSYQDNFNNAKKKVINKCYPYGATEVQAASCIERYSDVVIEVADYLYSKDGAAGEASHTENGVSRTYKSIDEILREVTPNVGTVFKEG